MAAINPDLSTDLNGRIDAKRPIAEAIACSKLRTFTTGEHIGAITVSAGLTIAAPHEPLEVIVERADGVLYQAKGEARNRICTA